LATIIGPVFTIANFYLNQDEIIEAFCENKEKPELNCNGNCHLSKELNKQIDKVPNQEKNNLNLSVFLPRAYNDIKLVELKHPKLKKNYNSYYINNYHYVVMDNILHPPQV
jgi:hypothetical protein